MKKAIVMVYEDRAEIQSEETGSVFSTYYFLPLKHHDNQTTMTVNAELFEELNNLTETGWKYEVRYA